MAMVQVALEVPDDIYLGLLSGDLVRRGGVVRDAAGQIVVHLKEVDLPNEVAGKALANKALALAKQNRELAQRAAELTKQNKIILIGVGVATAAAAVSGLVYHVMKSREEKKKVKELSETESSFNQAMKEYLDSVREGNLNESALAQVIESVDSIKESLDGDTISIDFNDGQLDALVVMLKDYTERLAEANKVELEDAPVVKEGQGSSRLTLLKHYLNEQQRILKAA